MKLLKSLLVLFIAVSITSCSSNEDNSFELVSTNLVGTYKLTAYKSVETETATSSTGTETKLSETTKIGGSFTVDVTLNTDKTYSIDGNFIVTSNNGDNEQAVVILASNGTYNLNEVSKTITLTALTDGALVDGKFDIKTFNENKIVLKQEVEGSGDVRIDAITDITLERK